MKAGRAPSAEVAVLAGVGCSTLSRIFNPGRG